MELDSKNWISSHFNSRNILKTGNIFTKCQHFPQLVQAEFGHVSLSSTVSTETNENRKISKSVNVNKISYFVYCLH